MKRVFLFLLCTLLMTGVAVAGEVTFQWNSCVGADGYRIFVRAAGDAYDYVSPAWEGTELTATIGKEGGSYAAVARAYNAGGESGDSNEVTFVLVPNAPQSFVILFP